MKNKLNGVDDDGKSWLWRCGGSWSQSDPHPCNGMN